MTLGTDRVVVEDGNLHDGKAIIEILEEDNFKGSISLIYTRRPDAYASFLKEGDSVNIFVAREILRNKILGCGVVSYNQLFINGSAAELGYLFGLRLKKEYQKKSRILKKGYEHCLLGLQGRSKQFFITTVLEDNGDAIKLFAKKRSFMPEYTNYGKYITHIIKTNMRVSPCSELVFRQTNLNDTKNLLEFLACQGKRFQFFPVLHETDFSLDNGKNVPSISDFYLILNLAGEIVAAGAAWDQRSYKQYIIKGYKGLLKLLYPISFVFPLFGYPALTKKNQVACFFTLSFWAVKDDDPRLFNFFLASLSKARSDYSYFVVGMHEKNSLCKVINNIRHLKYASCLYLVSRDVEKGISDLNPNLVPYLECGRL